MSEFKIESESIDVEQIMGQIRTRINEKRGEDYTDEQIRELANVKLERFLDPKNIRSGMVQYYQKRLKEKEAALRDAPQAPPSFEFDPESIYRSSRGLPGQVLYRIRKLLSPVLKFFFNPAPIVHALTVQQQINERQAKVISQMVRTQTEFIEIAALNYEVMNNLVVEMTRLSIEMKNHRMRVESVAGRLDFDERRARSLEKVVQYREGAAEPAKTDDASPERRRRRRRRGRRRPAGATTPETGETSERNASQDGPASGGSPPEDAQPEVGGETDRPAESTASTPVEPVTTASSASSGEHGRPQAQESSSSPVADPSHGASAPPASDSTGPGSDHSAASVAEPDPSER